MVQSRAMRPLIRGLSLDRFAHPGLHNWAASPILFIGKRLRRPVEHQSSGTVLWAQSPWNGLPAEAASPNTAVLSTRFRRRIRQSGRPRSGRRCLAASPSRESIDLDGPPSGRPILFFRPRKWNFWRLALSAPLPRPSRIYLCLKQAATPLPLPPSNKCRPA